MATLVDPGRLPTNSPLFLWWWNPMGYWSPKDFLQVHSSLQFVFPVTLRLSTQGIFRGQKHFLLSKGELRSYVGRTRLSFTSWIVSLLFEKNKAIEIRINKMWIALLSCTGWRWKALRCGRRHPDLPLTTSAFYYYYPQLVRGGVGILYHQLQ